MTLADMILNFYKGKSITVVKCVHDNATGKEAAETVECGADSTAFDAFTYAELYDSKVMMFECVKKNTIKVWTYREIN